MSKSRETPQARKKRASRIVEILEATYPTSTIALNFATPFQLLIATILSAQCTDVRVNMVTPALFKAYPTPQAFLDAPAEELEKAIFSTGFYRNKAKSIRAACAMLIEQFGGEVPHTMDELVMLPGVGRKTANVILGHCFATPGMVVDTHVKRINNLLELTSESDPVKIEHDLMAVFPQEKWTELGHLFGDHGRAICIARRPKCEICPLLELCPTGRRNMGYE
jgi:endonuclease-3